MRADTHDGPEQNRSTSRPNTLMQLSRSSLLELRLATRGRAIHARGPTLTHSDTWQRLSCRQSGRKPESLCSHRVLSLDLSRRWGRGDTQRGRTNLDHSIVQAARTAITNKTMDAAAKSTNLIMTLFTSAWTRLWEIRSAT